ncbi:TPM domain-containing protein [Plantibacter sp. YIM 135347]|uniref:TPM domain-containing protein n=1 Tax=Plantibacter sp. YIM 135347 TaxID=3423919 RepID=UPI003D348E68
MRARWAVSIWALCVALLVGGSGVAAFAADPVQLGGSRVVDDSSVLSSSELSQVEQASAKLSSDKKIDLWVVYVPTFTNPSDAEGWANQTASDNGLGPTQYLLAIATDGRQMYLSGDSNGPVTGDQLGAIEQQLILPALQNDDWAGAGVAAATGLATAAGGGTVSAGGSGGGGGAGWVIFWILIAVAAIAFVMFLVARRRRKGAVAGGAKGGQAVDPLASLPIEDLSRQAGSALVQTDDAVRTSEEELGFATASYGEASTVDFTKALDQAKADLSQAFALKQRLDDAEPDTEADTRAWNIQIIRLCERANHSLDEQAASFDELRALEKNAPAAVEEMRARAAAAGPSVQAARDTVASLATRYSPDAFATVVDNPDQATERLAFVGTAVNDASTKLAAGDSGSAAVGIRAAEEALDQSALLLGAVKRVEADLAAADQAVAARLAELDSDLAGAKAQPDPNGQLGPVIGSTTAAVAAVRQALASGRTNPIPLLAQLDAANTQIDGAMQGVRSAIEQQQRAAAALGQALTTAQAQVSAAEDFITSRRGAVGAEARTRLAESGRTLVQAQSLAATDPAQALALAQRANSLASQAVQYAQSDVGQFQTQSNGGGGNNGVLGAVLGGILINSVLGGGGGGGGGMFGGGSGGGGRSSGGGGSSRSPGSFGGSGTRSRRGGGRF